MNLSQFIRNELNPNLNETAFILGNGINNHCKTTSSWKNLLTDLAEEYIGADNDYEKILNDNSVSYPEFFDLIQISSNTRDETFDYKSIKKGIRQGFEKWTAQKVHSLWADTLIKLDRPLLTTNYDFLLEESSSSIESFMKSRQYNKKFFRPLRFKKINSKSKRAGFTPFYPWHSYYSHKEIANAKNEFAIWHIHGFYEYPSSIRLGLSDYMGAVGKARRWIMKSTGNPSNHRKELNKWHGNNSWLDIFLHNNIVIVGLSLEIQETFLRWLFIEREKLYKKHPDARKKAWFIYNKNEKRDKILEGKKLFFEKLNIQIIEANSYKQIFEVFPKRLKKST
ncbi:SIR2 family protein [Aurantibacillus circumpalustris]|uniref:SIR2 family protein n=1 Tax=Aurantibacillus circumpalustris TaxID=3036359 RepID=UPI00295B8A2D|nr:SIR2 family protein [Aurantibacillus circumpalustris]